MIATDTLLQDLQRVYAEEGRCSYFMYLIAGQYSGTAMLHRFGKWNHALKQAGLPLSKLGRPRKR
jgi:hypothetical protein